MVVRDEFLKSSSTGLLVQLVEERDGTIVCGYLSAYALRNERWKGDIEELGNGKSK